MLATTFKTLSEFVSFLAQSFKLSAIVPAFLFLVLNFVFVIPSIPKTYLMSQVTMMDMSEKLVFSIFCASLMGYILTVLNIPIIKLFEGYPWMYTRYGRVLIERQSERKYELGKRLIELEQSSESQTNSTDLDGRRSKSTEEEVLYQYYVDSFPDHENSILPTTLGNIIAAFESYPYRYGIDAVTIWPRLVPILSEKQYSAFVEREKASLDFMLNSSLLLFILSLEVIYTSLLYTSQMLPSIFLTVVILLAAISCYYIAIIAAGSWGMTVKVAFDLYRLPLLKSLNIRDSDIAVDEKRVWKTISDFYKDSHKDNWIAFSALVDYSKMTVKEKE